MTADKSRRNGKQRLSIYSDTTPNVEPELRTHERGPSTDDTVVKGIDVDAYFADRKFLFSSRRRRRASFIL